LKEVDRLKKSRAFAIIVVLVIGVLLLLPYLVEGLVWTTLGTSALYAVGMFALVLLLLTGSAQQSTKGKAKGEESGEIKTITSLACHSCEFSEDREFQRGDFVGKALGKCPKCKKEKLYIRAIYALDEKKGKKP
jgi:hypothetical protein